MLWSSSTIDDFNEHFDTMDTQHSYSSCHFYRSNTKYSFKYINTDSGNHLNIT